MKLPLLYSTCGFFFLGFGNYNISCLNPSRPVPVHYWLAANKLYNMFYLGGGFLDFFCFQVTLFFNFSIILCKKAMNFSFLLFHCLNCLFPKVSLDQIFPFYIYISITYSQHPMLQES